MIWSLRHLLPPANGLREVAPGMWVRVMPEPFEDGLVERLRNAWSVMRGSAFAVRYPVDGEFEAILEDRGWKIVSNAR